MTKIFFNFHKHWRKARRHKNKMSKPRNLFNIYYLKTYLCIYKYSYCVLPTTQQMLRCQIHTNISIIWNPFIPGHWPLIQCLHHLHLFSGMKRSKTTISYIQPFKYPMSVQILCFFDQIRISMIGWLFTEIVMLLYPEHLMWIELFNRVILMALLLY